VTERTYDLIALGEPLLRLSPPGFTQLRRATSLNLCIVGSQLNVAANLARLGRRTAFMTKIPDGPLGWLVEDVCSSYGLDTSFMLRIPGAKLGVTYVEFSTAPRPPQAIYDRAGSAASTLSVEDFAWDTILGQTRMAYTDGIFPGLSACCDRACHAFLAAARRQGCTTCFDLNYRQHLWTPAAARDAGQRLLPLVDILAMNRDVAEIVFGYAGDDDTLMRRFADDFGCRMVCQTNREIHGLQHGAWTSQALVDGSMHYGRRQEFAIVDRYGTGDAWFAGCLYGWQQFDDMTKALNFGNAVCALAHTIEGDIIHLHPAEVTALLDHADVRVRR
jgi:2-dehydro-3-deoxygluconokinase